MLCDPKVHTTVNPILTVIHNAGVPRRLFEGIYVIDGFSFAMMIEDGEQHYDVTYPQFEFKCGEYEFNCYGVCDSPAQFLADVGESLRIDSRRLCVSFTRIAKSEQYETGGWRWRKWGPYIGHGAPTCEYLYDEPVFEEVWVYHVYNLDAYAQKE